jgi:hypothetical protein
MVIYQQLTPMLQCLTISQISGVANNMSKGATFFSVSCFIITALTISLQAQSPAGIRETATVASVSRFKAPESGQAGILVVIETQKRVSFVAKAHSMNDLDSLKRGDTVSLCRANGTIHIKRVAADSLVSLPLIRIDPCPQDMKHGESCVSAPVANQTTLDSKCRNALVAQ